MSDDVPQYMQIFKNSEVCPTINIMQMSGTKHQDHGKPTYLITPEHKEIDFIIDKIPQNLKPVSIHSVINS